MNTDLPQGAVTGVRQYQLADETGAMFIATVRVYTAPPHDAVFVEADFDPVVPGAPGPSWRKTLWEPQLDATVQELIAALELDPAWPIVFV